MTLRIRAERIAGGCLAAVAVSLAPGAFAASGEHAQHGSAADQQKIEADRAKLDKDRNSLTAAQKQMNALVDTTKAAREAIAKAKASNDRKTIDRIRASMPNAKQQIAAMRAGLVRQRDIVQGDRAQLNQDRGQSPSDKPPAGGDH